MRLGRRYLAKQTIADARLVAWVGAHGPATPDQIADALEIGRGAAIASRDRMLLEGYVEQAGDGPAVRATAKAVELLAQREDSPTAA